MNDYKSKVYVMVDAEHRIIGCEGGYTIGNISDPKKWILIDEGYGDRYNLCQGNYFPMRIRTNRGAYRYKLVDGKPVECTPEEIAEQEKANRPDPVTTTDDVLNALLGVTE